MFTNSLNGSPLAFFQSTWFMKQKRTKGPLLLFSPLFEVLNGLKFYLSVQLTFSFCLPIISVMKYKVFFDLKRFRLVNIRKL